MLKLFYLFFVVLLLNFQVYFTLSQEAGNTQATSTNDQGGQTRREVCENSAALEEMKRVQQELKTKLEAESNELSLSKKEITQLKAELKQITEAKKKVEENVKTTATEKQEWSLGKKVYYTATQLLRLYYNLGRALVRLIMSKIPVEILGNLELPTIGSVTRKLEVGQLHSIKDEAMAQIQYLDSQCESVYIAHVQPQLIKFLEVFPEHKGFIPVDNWKDVVLFVALVFVGIGHVFMIGSKLCCCCRRQKRKAKTTKVSKIRTKDASGSEPISHLDHKDPVKAKNLKKNR